MFVLMGERSDDRHPGGKRVEFHGLALRDRIDDHACDRCMRPGLGGWAIDLWIHHLDIDAVLSPISLHRFLDDFKSVLNLFYLADGFSGEVIMELPSQFGADIPQRIELMSCIPQLAGV